MNRTAVTFLVCAFLGLASKVMAAPATAQTPLNQDLFRTFMTNSVLYFTDYSMPVDQKARYGLALANASMNTHNQTKAAAYLDATTGIARRNGLKTEEGAAYYLSAMLADISQDLPAALASITKAEALFLEIGDQDRQWRCLLFRANLLHRRGKYGESVEAYTALLDIATGPQADLIRGECLAEIALLSCKMGRTNEVPRLAQQALKLAQSNHNAKCEADCYKILGNQATASGQQKEAMRYYEEAVAKYKEVGDIHGQANCLYNIGISLQEQKEYNKAILCFQNAIAIFTSSSSVGGVGIANMQLGRTYYLMGYFPKAEAALDLAKVMLTKCQDLARLAETESYLADLKAAQQDNPASLDHRNAAARLYDQAGLKDRAAQELRKTQSKTN